MRILLTTACVLLAAFAVSCDMRSQTAKDEMEKFSGTPTPTIAPIPTEAQVSPMDIFTVDVNVEGDPISINSSGQTKTISCTKFNRIRISGGTNKITIKGACRQIMINGDHNEITADAAAELVFNGSGNIIRYTRFPNGKKPIVTDNGPDNVAVKMWPQTVPDNQSNRKNVK